MSDSGEFWGGLFVGAALCYAGLVWVSGYEKPEQKEAVFAELPPPRTGPTRPIGRQYLTSLESGTSWFVDANQVQGPRSARRVWVEKRHGQNKTTPYRYTQSLYVFDCSTTGYKMLSTASYKADDNTAYESADWNPQDLDYDYAIPASVMGSVYKHVCQEGFDLPPN